MALILADRVRETSTTTGTGALSLAGAVVGYQTFSSAIGNTNTCYYAISNPGVAEWEVGIGTYATSGNTLTRTTILKSSNANAAVSFSAGTKDVFVTYPAGKSVYLDASGNASALGTPASGTVTNLTGTASININGTVGATTPSTGAFTTLSATGLISRTMTAATNAAVMSATGSTTGAVYYSAGNTSGNAAFGVEGSSTGYLITGSTAYDMALSGNGGIAFSANNGTAMQMRLSSTGLAVTGTLSATGAVAFTGPTLTLGAATVYDAIVNTTESMYFNVDSNNDQTGSKFEWGENRSATTGGTKFATLDVSGLAVTGTLTSTLDATIYGVTVGRGGGAVSTNTAVGASALSTNSTNGQNTVFGYNAGYYSTGSANTYIGYNSGPVVTASASGSYNTALGASAFQANTTASNNTAVGYQAGYANTTGSNSTAIGYQALNAQTTASGGHNTAVGAGALKAVTTGYQNVAVGYNALTVCTGTYNVAIGDNAGGAMLSSSGVVIVGGYDGNADGLDVRNATDYVVISTGNGTRQLSMKEGYTLALDSAVPNAGTGITFPATQSASSDANTLDDYEEGTFTPVWTNLTVVGTPTYSAIYTKIGRKVFCEIGVASTVSTASTIDVTSFSGLPFSCGAVRSVMTATGSGGTTSSLGTGGLITTSGNPPTWSANSLVNLAFNYTV